MDYAVSELFVLVTVRETRLAGKTLEQSRRWVVPGVIRLYWPEIEVIVSDDFADGYLLLGDAAEYAALWLDGLFCTIGAERTLHGQIAAFHEYTTQAPPTLGVYS